MTCGRCITTSALVAAVLLFASQAEARNSIRGAFFTVYPAADNTQLDDLPSNTKHCGICHFDFNGGGPRNPYGLAVEVARNDPANSTDEEAILSIELFDSDGDGFNNVTEITSTLFANTPTFPGLTSGDEGNVSNIPWAEVSPYVTPTGGADTTPPSVTVLSPNGGESYNAETTTPVTWTATDASGISHIDIYMSDNNGASWDPVALNESNDGTLDFFVRNLPGSQTLIRVEAFDNAGNNAHDDSDASFTIIATPAGYVPTTLRDMKMPGTQPLTVTRIEDPDVVCVTCHGNYDTNVEPWYNWKGSMMAQATRDPIFYACLAIAEQDAPSVGDLCLRCHTPTGWLDGRSFDTSGNSLTVDDRDGVSCDFCHRLIDRNYQPGISPPEDEALLNDLGTLPAQYGNGQYIVDPQSTKRGPYSDPEASHGTIYSPFHSTSGICGTCHNVSNPVFVYDGAPGRYAPDTFDSEHPDGDEANMLPIERTYSEWANSDYASVGVFAPEFAGDKPDGIVSSCQDCHMKDLTGRGCNEQGAPTRGDLPHHDMTGGNHFMADIVAMMYPAEVDTARLNAGKWRAIGMLRKAASLALAAGQDGPNPTVTVTVTNETGHKLPTGYPEGRRMWINVKGYDAVGGTLLYESGAYDVGTAVLTHDPDAKIYEVQPGISNRLSALIGLPVGKSFHFVLNDTLFLDNRIPPRGFTNAAFLAVQAPPVGYSYADSQYWDDTEYTLPPDTRFVEVTLYYQGTTKEYVEFLRDENVTNSAGIDFYNAWAATGKAEPIAMESDTISVDINPTGIGDTPRTITALQQNVPNPFNPSTTIRYSLKSREHVRIAVYDVRGSVVKVLVDEERPAGYQRVDWYGLNQSGVRVASGIYFIKMTTADRQLVKKAVMLK